MAELKHVRIREVKGGCWFVSVQPRLTRWKLVQLSVRISINHNKGIEEEERRKLLVVTVEEGGRRKSPVKQPPILLLVWRYS